MSIQSMLWPESVAIIGASTNRDSPAGLLLDVFCQYNFGVRLYAINLSGAELANGIRAYRDLDDLPEVPELCLVVVAAERVLGVLEQCRDRGVKSALVYSSAASDAISYPEIRDGIQKLTADSGFRVAGPNSVGWFNSAHGLASTWSPAIDMRGGATPPRDGPIAIIAQSGGLGFGILAEATRRGLGVRYVASTGNEADIECAEVAQFCINDPKIKVVLMFVEGLHTPTDFVTLGLEAHKASKSIIIAKVGNSAAGREASALHTAHLAGSDTAYDAVFQQFGFTRAGDTEEMVDYAMGISRCPPMTGRRVGVVTYSGGAGIWLADACEGEGLYIPTIDEEKQISIRKQVGTHGAARNPVDLSGPTLSATCVQDAVKILLELSYIDAVAVTMPMVGQRSGAQLVQDLAAMQRQAGKPIAMFSYSGVSSDWLSNLSNSEIAWYSSPLRLARSLACLADRFEDAEVVQKSFVPQRKMMEESRRPIASTQRLLDEFEVKKWLRIEGVPTTEEKLAKTPEEARTAALNLGSPVAMKVQAVGVVHKSAQGLVALHVDLENVESTFRSLWSKCVATIGENPVGILIQEMIPKGVEMIVGTLIDEEFGPLVMIGSGGTATDLILDRVFRVAPIDAAEALRACRKLRIFAICHAMGTAQSVDWLAFAEIVADISRLCWRHRHQLSGLDLNPIVVLPAGSGAVVADGSAIIGSRD